MTTTATRPMPLATPVVGAQADTVMVLSVFAAVLTLLPGRYVLGALGAAGTPAGIMAVLCLCWYLFAMLTPRTTPIRGRQPVRLIILLFAAAILVSYAVAMTRTLPALELNGADRGLILLAGWAGVALLAADGISTLDRLETLRRRLVAGGTVMAVLGVTQFFTGLDLAGYIAIPGLTSSASYTSLLQRDEFNRPMATATHPIEFGVVLAMLLPLAVHGAMYAGARPRGRRWLQVALIATALPMTVSRSAILGLAVAALVVLPTWSGRQRRRAYAVMLIFTFAMRVAIPGLLGTVTSLITEIGTDSSTVARTDDYSAVGQALAAHPWFGQGFGTYLPQTYRILDNQYLGSLIETGIIGLLALIVVLFSGWFLARAARRASTLPAHRHLAQCFAAASAVAIFSYGTFDAFGFPMVANLTFLIVGCCGALWRLTRMGDFVPDRTPEPDRAPEYASRGEDHV
jgi:O-antigen ligase